MKNNIIKILTIIAVPLIFAIYLLDRIITIPFILVEVYPIQNWLFNTNAMQQSLIRVVVCTLLYSIYFIITSIF